MDAYQLVFEGIPIGG